MDNALFFFLYKNQFKSKPCNHQFYRINLVNNSLKIYLILLVIQNILKGLNLKVSSQFTSFFHSNSLLSQRWRPFTERWRWRAATRFWNFLHPRRNARAKAAWRTQTNPRSPGRPSWRNLNTQAGSHQTVNPPLYVCSCLSCTDGLSAVTGQRICCTTLMCIRAFSRSIQICPSLRSTNASATAGRG